MKRTILFILTALILTPQVFAISDLQLGARPQAMGGAYTALSNDANSTYWNPAGLSKADHGEIQFMHWMFSDVEQVMVDYLSLAYPLTKGALGFAWVRKGATLEEGVNNTETSMSENDIYLSYGMGLTDYFSFGLSLKRSAINAEIGDGSGFGFDMGVLYQPFESHNFTLAATGKNLVADMKDEMLKPFYTFGTAYVVGFSENMHELTFAADITTKEDINETEGMSIKYAAGMEYAFNYTDYSFALRGGINSSAVTLGFGLGWDYLDFNYAMVLMNEDTIGDSHKFGIVWKFGEKK